MRVPDYGLLDAITPVSIAVDDAESEGRFRDSFDVSPQVPALIVKEAGAIRDEELQISNLGRIDGGIVNLGDTATRKRVPDVAGGGVGSSDCVFCAARPLRLKSGATRGNTFTFAQKSPLVLKVLMTAPLRLQINLPRVPSPLPFLAAAASNVRYVLQDRWPLLGRRFPPHSWES